MLLLLIYLFNIMFIISITNAFVRSFGYNRELCVNNRKSWSSKKTRPMIPTAHHYTKRIGLSICSLRSHEDALNYT